MQKAKLKRPSKAQIRQANASEGKHRQDNRSQVEQLSQPQAFQVGFYSLHETRETNHIYVKLLEPLKII